MTIQDNPAQNNPAPECAPFGFPVYPLFCAGDPNNVAMGTTPEMVCPSVADMVKMWELLLDPGHMIFNPAGLNAKQHIWHLIHGFATNHYSAAATATGIHLASQMLQLESLSYNKETAVKLYAQGCLISADTTDLENSNVPCIGWFTVTEGSSDIGFKLNPEYTKDVDAIIPWTSLNSLNRAARIQIQPGALNFTLYEQDYGNQGLPQSESGSGPGPFKFTGIEHLFPVDRLDVPLAPRDQVTTIRIAISGSTGQINNWHFKQQGDRLNKSDCPEHAPCRLHINFNNIAPEVNNCSFLKTDGRPPWFTEVAVSSATLANSVTWSPTVYNNCLFNGVALIGHAPKASLIFNECCFTSTSVDIRNKFNTAHPMLGITLSDCFGTNRVPNSRQDSIHFKVDPGQAVDVFGTDRAPAENKANPVTVKDSGTATRYIRYITLDFVVGADHISDTPYGAAPAKITLMDRPDKYNPVLVNILGPAEVFMSNIAVSAIKCCPHRENHFVGINVVEPPRGIIFIDWIVTGGGNPSKTSVALSYSQGGTNIGVESLSAVLFDVLYIPAIDVDTSEHAAQFDLRYVEKWGKAGAWERARTIGLLRANATEENIAQIERVIERLAPTGIRDSAKPVPTSSIGTKSKIKP